MIKKTISHKSRPIFRQLNVKYSISILRNLLDQPVYRFHFFCTRRAYRMTKIRKCRYRPFFFFCTRRAYRLTKIRKCRYGPFLFFCTMRRDAGTGGGGRRGSCPPCLLLGGARGAKVPFKYKEYYITVSFQGAFS